MIKREKPKSILILHASVGAGHTRAAKAVAAALALESPESRVVVVDALDVARPLFKRVYGKGYLDLVEKAPALFGYLFELTDRRPSPRALGDRLRRAVQRWGANELGDLLAGGGWDAVVNTHFLAPEFVAALRSAGKLSAPQLTVVTDYDAHRIWAHDPCERCCVAGPLAAASLRGHGVPAAAIEITEFPSIPRSRFPSTATRHAALLRTVRRISRGRAVGRQPRRQPARRRSTAPCSPPPSRSEIVVVCGRNEDARRRLTAIRPPGHHRAKILGFTDRMREKLMAVADLLVTKPGGLTVSEALACGLPMALVSPIPGQEERNSDYLLENGAAVKAGSPVGADRKSRGTALVGSALGRHAAARQGLGPSPRGLRGRARGVGARPGAFPGRAERSRARRGEAAVPDQPLSRAGLRAAPGENLGLKGIIHCPKGPVEMGHMVQYSRTPWTPSPPVSTAVSLSAAPLAAAAPMPADALARGAGRARFPRGAPEIRSSRSPSTAAATGRPSSSSTTRMTPRPEHEPYSARHGARLAVAQRRGGQSEFDREPRLVPLRGRPVSARSTCCPWRG